MNPINNGLSDYLPDVGQMTPWKWQKELNITKEQAEYLYKIQREMMQKGYRHLPRK